MEDYVQRCLEPQYTEEEETRTWQSDPAFQGVVDLLNQHDYKAAASKAEPLASQFTDFHLPYYWWGGSLLALGKTERARKVLLRGIQRSKRKFMLCERLGEVEAFTAPSSSGMARKRKGANLAEAVYWWAQGIHCQETIAGWGGEVTSYLNLFYVADGVGLPGPAAAFKRRVDEIRAVHYEPAMARELVELARDQGNPEIREVIDGLRSRYLE